MKNTDELNEPAAALVEAARLPEQRHGDLKKLRSLLNRLDRIDGVKAETESLKVRLDNEINTALGTGDLSETMAKGLQVKRMQLEMVPTKLAQIEREQTDMLSKIQAEFEACFIDFQNRFTGMTQGITEGIISFLRPLVVEEYILEPVITTSIFPRTRLAQKMCGIVDTIRFHVSQGNYPTAARELLKREPEAGVIIAAAKGCEHFSKKLAETLKSHLETTDLLQSKIVAQGEK